MIDQKQHESSRIWGLTLGALGVVFGDIGTSPLYAIRECFSPHYGLPVNTVNVLGICSLMIWSLILIVSVKYILFVLRADNKGEGGILALLALAMPPGKTSGGKKRWLIYVGLFGAALLYGDGMITPAVTVLSAAEGLNLASPIFEPYTLPITLVILVLLFYMQSVGTSKICFIFGPLIVIYFAMLAALGIPQLIKTPFVLHSFNPLYAIDFFAQNGMHGFWALGSVFLAVTGCEALYADMGHFGRKPIRLAWTYFVFPALVLNYLGQGALLIDNPENIRNPFFLLAPSWALYPVIAMAGIASVIASQALISGVFSLTSQGILMGFVPRLRIVHTSSEEMGQIYIPAINWALMLCTIWLVLEFKSSSNLAGAYGIAVSLTMIITTAIALVVAVRRWRWAWWYAAILGSAMLLVDGVFLAANVPKIPHGGWFPLTIALIIFALMTTWKRGRRILAIRLRAQCDRFEDFIESQVSKTVFRIPGTALFMTSDAEMIPPALARNLKHNHVLHARAVILSLITKDVPRVNRLDRARVETFPNGVFRASVYFGFMENPTIQEVFESLRVKGLDIQLSEVTFFLGRETLIAARRHGGMALWREHLFSFMVRNAYRATQFFKIPADQVIEIGSQIEL